MHETLLGYSKRWAVKPIIIIIIIIIITSNDDPKPSTVISEQLPTGLIARHIKITPGTIIS